MSRASTTAASRVERDDVVAHADRLPQEVADLPPVVPGEVRPDPLAQVGGLAHVEGDAPAVDEPVHAGRAGERGGEAELGRLGVAGEPGEHEQVVQPEHAPRGRPLQQQVEQIGRGQGVVEGAVRRLVVEPEAVGQGAEAAVGHLVAHEAAGQRGRVDGRVGQAGPAVAPEGRVEEAEVEADVVADDDGAAEELRQRRQHRVHARRGRHHRRRDAGQHRDGGRDGRARVDQRVEGPQALAAPDLDGADLRDGILVGRAPGGLQVHDGEGHLGERGAELVEGPLHGRAR